MKICERDLPRIEKAFGFTLYEWQRDYLLEKKDYMPDRRNSGRTFAYIVRLLLSSEESLSKEDLTNYEVIDGKFHAEYSRWFKREALSINAKLVDAGFRTCLITYVDNKTPKEHRLKTVQPYFSDVKSGIKTFEIRKDDRRFKVGEILVLEEYRDTLDVLTEGYTGCTIRKRVTYILRDIPECYGLKKGYCILGLTDCDF